MSSLSSLRSQLYNHSSPRTCSGWSCICRPPFGFGGSRVNICFDYGPNNTATPSDIKKWQELRNSRFRRAFQKSLSDNMHIKTKHALAKMKRNVDQQLDDEYWATNSVLTDTREREREEESEYNRLRWYNEWRDESLASSVRSIQFLRE